MMTLKMQEFQGEVVLNVLPFVKGLKLAEGLGAIGRFIGRSSKTKNVPVLIRGVGAAAADDFLVATSSIKKSPGLVRYAKRLGEAEQAAADDLVAKLVSGNMNPGLGTKFLFKGVYEARARNGARVYFRHFPGIIEIVGKSNKVDQPQVIQILEKLYNVVE